LNVVYGTNIEECNLLNTSSRKSRIEDLHTAFADKECKAIFAVIGGFSSNQLYEEINYDLILTNPKILCGFSDTTGLALAIHTKTGLMTYVGPHFSTMGMELGNEYTVEYFKKTFFEVETINVKPAECYSQDSWYLLNSPRSFVPNNGPTVVRPGNAHGVAIGGNISLLRLIQGTPYFPSFDKPFVLFVEDDDMVKELFAHIFHQQVVALLMDKDFKRNLRGVIVGRCQEKSEMSAKVFTHIFDEILQSSFLDIPVVIDASFGHTTPMFTIPIGGRTELNAPADGSPVSIVFFEH
jgi:muramoyltetrapeptide carboxypeptidase